MNWYKILLRDNMVKNPLIADEASLNGLGDEDFECGKQIENWNTGAMFKVTEAANEGDPDDVLLNDVPLPVFSPRLQVAVTKSGIQGIQFLPVRVQRWNGSWLEGFAIANILNLVRGAVDREKSVLMVTPEDFPVVEMRGSISLIKPTLIGSTIADYEIVRLSEEPFPIFVSEKFRRLFMKNEFTGIGFLKVGVS